MFNNWCNRQKGTIRQKKKKTEEKITKSVKLIKHGWQNMKQTKENKKEENTQKFLKNQSLNQASQTQYQI